MSATKTYLFFFSFPQNYSYCVQIFFRIPNILRKLKKRHIIFLRNASGNVSDSENNNFTALLPFSSTNYVNVANEAL